LQNPGGRDPKEKRQREMTEKEKHLPRQKNIELEVVQVVQVPLTTREPENN